MHFCVSVANVSPGTISISGKKKKKHLLNTSSLHWLGFYLAPSFQRNAAYIWGFQSWDAGSCLRFFGWSGTIACGLDWFVDWFKWCASKCWHHGKGIPVWPQLILACQKYNSNWSPITLTLCPPPDPPDRPHPTPAFSCHVCVVISCSAVSPLSHYIRQQ